MTGPQTFAETLPVKGWLKRLEIAFRGGAPAEIRRRRAGVTIEDGPWGQWAPTPAQARIIRIARGSPAFQSALRIHAALRIDSLRPGPIDERFHGLAIRFYPMLGASFRHMMLTPRDYQADERRFFHARATGEGVFVDVGANAGVYSLWAGATWPGRPVIAFEPVAMLAEILDQNARMAGLDAFKLHRAVAGAEDGEAAFSETAQSMAYGADMAPTPCRSLVSVLSEAGCGPDGRGVAGIKIDAEGVEDQILAPFLAEAPDAMLPHAILIEHVGRHLWETDCFEMLAKRGYREVFRNKLNAGLVLGTAPGSTA